MERDDEEAKDRRYGRHEKGTMEQSPSRQAQWGWEVSEEDVRRIVRDEINVRIIVAAVLATVALIAVALFRYIS